MASRYNFFFNDLAGNEYIGVISSLQYTGDFEVIEGSANMEYNLSTNPFQPLQIKACNVSLLATLENDLSDIYNEVDRYWTFKLLKNGITFFNGYISTEQMEQNYVNRSWILNFDAFDPLSYLESFGYYNDSGSPYTGDATLIQIIVNCLNKGFNDISERLGIKAYHYLSIGGNDLFTNTYLDQGQFYDDDAEAQDCKTVLEDILKSLGCFIIQYGIFWYIMPVPTWRDLISTPITLNLYNAQGQFNSTEVLSPDGTNQRIGSNVNNAVVHHSGANQRFYIERFVNNFRINHSFDYSPQILPNGELIQESGTMPNWTLTGEATVVNNTLEIEGKELVSQIALAATSSSVVLKKDDQLEVEILIEFIDDPTEQTFKIILTNTPSATDYYFSLLQPVEEAEATGEWRTVDRTVEFKPIEGIGTYNIELQPLPEDGELYVEVYTGIFGNALTVNSKSILNHVKIKSKEQAIESEQFTYTRIDTNNGQTPDPYEIRFNTVDRNILRNIFKDSNGLALSSFTKDAETTTMADEIGRMFLSLYSQNQKVFSGGVYGNSEAFTPKRIDFFKSTFIVTSYNKLLSQNQANLELRQVFFSEPEFTKEVLRIYKEANRPLNKQ